MNQLFAPPPGGDAPDRLRIRSGADVLEGLMEPQRWLRKYADDLAWIDKRQEHEDDRLERGKLDKNSAEFAKVTEKCLQMYRDLPPANEIFLAIDNLTEALGKSADKEQLIMLIGHMIDSYPNVRPERLSGYIDACLIALLEDPDRPPSVHVVASAIVLCLQQIKFPPSAAELVEQVCEVRKQFRRGLRLFEKVRYTRSVVEDFLLEAKVITLTDLGMEDDDWDFPPTTSRSH